MKRNAIGAAVLLAMLPATGAFAAGLDRSGQPVAPLFQPGNLVELGWTSIFPTVKGHESSGAKREIPDMADKYSFPSGAVKYQANDNWSFAFLYDHPFGADASYHGVNIFTTTPAERAQAAVNPIKAQVAAQVAAQLPGIISQQMAAKGMTPAQIQAALPAAVAQQLPGAVAQQMATPAVQQKIAALTPAATGPDVTSASVTTQSFSLIAGYQPNKNWNIYGGPVYQTIKGDVHLRGAAYSVFNGYDATFGTSGAWGYLVGAAYQIPDIAFRAALTYRSAIKHNVDTTENFTNLAGVATNNTTKIKTPQSVNLDLQTGVAANTVAFANLRWVDWSSFSIQPTQFGAVSRQVGPLVGKPKGFNLVEYGKDQYSATVGVGRKFNEQWSGSIAAGWDSGTGEYVTTLGPVNGNWNLGVGAQYSPTKDFYISAGVKYFWLGNAKGQVASKVGTTNYDGEFRGNRAVALGVKAGYRF
ncbi:OmpP1/FadL family transporter [Brachymonas denitrificans]|uniref:OmpP1/FadL family transporter n=1 Tax=Brachymonas denitrificans TaxID=28220 RepID=UPI00321F68E6